MAKETDARDLVEIWKTVAATQQHFNTIGMTVRGFFVTVMIAIVAGIGVAIRDDIRMTGLADIPVGVVLSLFAAFVAWMFYFMDRSLYHQLLRGATNEARRIETELSALGKHKIELCDAIDKSSEILVPKFFRWRPIRWFLSKTFITDRRFAASGHMRSAAKIALFYKSFMWVMVAFAVLIYLNSALAEPSQPASVSPSAPTEAASPGARQRPGGTDPATKDSNRLERPPIEMPAQPPSVDQSKALPPTTAPS